MTLEQSYDDFPRIEEDFQNFLDESLDPRGPDLLYDLVAGLGLPAGAHVLDLGCGEGAQALELARRFRFAVTGIDPVARNLEVARASADAEPAIGSLLSFRSGNAESIPLPGASIDLIWSRESLYFYDLSATPAECRRVLRPGGRMLIYYNPAGDRLEPREAEWQWERTDAVPYNMDVRHVEAAFTSAGFTIDQSLDIGSEFGEFSQETRGEPGRRLLHAARLLRDPQRYIAMYGQTNYDIMLGDCFWHIHRMIGKLTSRVYILRAL